MKSSQDVIVEPTLKNYEGSTSQPGDSKKDNLSNLIGLLDLENNQENQTDLTMQQIHAQNQNAFNNNCD